MTARGKPLLRRRLTRRQFLPGAAGVVALGASGFVGNRLAGGAPSSGGVSSTSQSSSTDVAGVEVHSFLTRPDLRPPVIRISDLRSPAVTETSPRFIALSSGDVIHRDSVQSGPLIIDRQGRVVWFKPLPNSVYDLQVQSYQGKPVLTWWNGKIVQFHGVGQVTVADSSYTPIKTIDGVSGQPADLHEFVITSRGTALLTNYTQENADLTSHGGPSDGTAWSCRVLEIDLSTGKLLLDWNSLDHVPVSDSYEPYSFGQEDAYDYFHLNSIAELEDGTLLISGRATWAIYALERSSGKVLWQLGGRRSDFDIAPDARFSWQHHVRPHGSSTLTVFDNGYGTGSYSKGLMLSYDVSAKQVKLIREFLHPARFLSHSQGSVQTLPNGNVFVGWGIQPYFSQYSADGTMISNGQFPMKMRSYRAYLVDWVGQPSDKPAVVARSNPAGGFIVYVSWNGATEVHTWTVLAGKHSSDLTPVGSQPWSNFETAIAVNSKGPAFQVVAHDRSGMELGRSEVI